MKFILWTLYIIVLYSTPGVLYYFLKYEGDFHFQMFIKIRLLKLGYKIDTTNSTIDVWPE